MRIIRMIFVLVAIFLMQPVFADDQDMSPGDRPCAAVAQACVKAGYGRKAGPGKNFWMSCMKPLILGQTVNGATVDADTVKTCRASKIEQLKKELQELEKAS